MQNQVDKYLISSLIVPRPLPGFLSFVVQKHRKGLKHVSDVEEVNNNLFEHTWIINRVHGCSCAIDGTRLERGCSGSFSI